MCGTHEGSSADPCHLERLLVGKRVREESQGIAVEPTSSRSLESNECYYSFESRPLLNYSCGRPIVVLCGNPNVLQARQIRSITAATNPRMSVGLSNREAITVEWASALTSENVRRRQFLSSLGEGLLSTLDHRPKLTDRGRRMLCCANPHKH